MAKPAPAPKPVVVAADGRMPAWLWRFVVADWPPVDAEEMAAEAEVARENGSVEFAREIFASGRRSTAISAWAVDHEMTTRELRALVKETHPDASPYPVRPSAQPSI